MFRIVLSLSWFLILAISAPVRAENEGLDDLDKATQLKVTAQNLEDLNEVVDRLDTAIEKGLDQENSEFAQQLLTATLLQRGTLFASAVFNSDQDDQPRGLRAIQFRQFALNDLVRAVEGDPKQWDAQLLIGRLQSLPMGDPRAAKKALTLVADAEEATPDQRAQALALRSGLQRNAERQLEDLNRAVELRPELPDYWRLRAQHQLRSKKFEESLADVDKALQLEPEHAATNELRGMILLGMERYDDALASFNKASELVPEAALPYQHRGELYRQKGDLDKAVEQLTKALELSPDNVAALIVRAGVYYELEQPEKALADIDHAIRVQPQLIEPYRMKAEILAATDRLDLAMAELERLIPQVNGPVQALLLSRLGAFHMIASQPRKAIEVLDKAIALDSDDSGAYRLRADAYLNIGKHAEAVADFRRALADSEEDEGLLNNFAWVLATSPDDNLRDGAEAVKLATAACELTGYETPHILSTLAAAYAETGDFENAVKWSKEAVELSQKEIGAATTDEQRTLLESNHEQLKKEVTSYEEGKPVRERQDVQDAATTTSTKDHAAAPALEPAPARTADF
jgi:tetratricopeptide (TPR) repeat protein